MHVTIFYKKCFALTLIGVRKPSSAAILVWITVLSSVSVKTRICYQCDHLFPSQDIHRLAQQLNEKYVGFRDSNDGIHFSGNVFVVADSIGSIMVYDLLVSCCPDFRRVRSNF